jgi:hypothetical protein
LDGDIAVVSPWVSEKPDLSLVRCTEENEGPESYFVVATDEDIVFSGGHDGRKNWKVHCPRKSMLHGVNVSRMPLWYKLMDMTMVIGRNDGKE